MPKLGSTVAVGFAVYWLCCNPRQDPPVPTSELRFFHGDVASFNLIRSLTTINQTDYGLTTGNGVFEMLPVPTESLPLNVDIFASNLPNIAHTLQQPVDAVEATSSLPTSQI
jgi:hypothetical protein